MGRAKFKSADFPRHLNDICDRRQQEFDKRRKRTYWTIRRSDDRIAKTNDAIRRTRELLQQSGRSPKAPEPKPDPDLAWGELAIQGIKNPKRRADD